MKRFLPTACLAIIINLFSGAWGLAADHGDMSILSDLGRPDARLTDLYAFSNGENLVLVLCTNPAIPPTVSNYLFADDLVLQFHIDRHSQVDFRNADDLARFGGTIVNPRAVTANSIITVTFNREGLPSLNATGIPRKYRHQILAFAGLRDDPFIRRPRIGRNVAAVVVELPLNAVVDRNGTLLIWATSAVPVVHGLTGDHAGRALRSMFIEESNVLSPQQQFLRLGMTPDVIIYDVTRPAAFPNGRSLTDDVVDLVVDIPGGMLPGEAPDFPTMNDVPFLGQFPYLAPPH